MAVTETLGGNITVQSGGDFFHFKGSGTIAEGRLVVVNTSITDEPTVQEAGDNAQNVLGYVQADFEASDQLRIVTGGIARLYNNSGITIDAGDNVAPGAAGSIKAVGDLAGTSGVVVGTALESITTAGFGKVLVNISYNPGAGS